MSQKNKKFISIIIVNYKSRNFLNKCLKSIDQFIVPVLKNKFEVIVVNNDKRNLNLESNFNFKLRVLENNANLGFSDANNKGSVMATGKYLFFLNPDTEFRNESFEKVINFLKSEESKNKILGLKILDVKNGKVQDWSCGYKTSLFNIISRNRFVKKPWINKDIVSVDWVSGCAMIIEKKLFDKIKGFDDNFFMYFEDQDLCLKAKNVGAEILYFPLGEVFHWGGKSWDGESEQKKEYYKSQDYFFVKHFPKWQGCVLRFFRGIFK